MAHPPERAAVLWIPESGVHAEHERWRQTAILVQVIRALASVGESHCTAGFPRFLPSWQLCPILPSLLHSYYTNPPRNPTFVAENIFACVLIGV
jgi:hypothetical protein